MKIYSYGDIKGANKGGAGCMMLLYGETGVGKTCTSIQTCELPCLYIQTEPRSLRPSIVAAGRKELDEEGGLTVAEYEDFLDLIKYMEDADNFAKYKTVIVDSLTHLSNVLLPDEITGEAYEARSDKEKGVKQLVNRTKMTMEGYGGLSANLFRLLNLSGKISRMGKVVVYLCLLNENPKWNRDLAAGPALKGKEFPTSMPGYFDLIGRLQTRVNEEDEIIYPPYVYFRAPDDSFMAKFTGGGNRKEGVLNIEKIVKLTQEESRKKKTGKKENKKGGVKDGEKDASGKKEK